MSRTPSPIHERSINAMWTLNASLGGSERPSMTVRPKARLPRRDSRSSSTSAFARGDPRRSESGSMRFASYTCRTESANPGNPEPGPAKMKVRQKKRTLPLSSSFKSRTGITGPLRPVRAWQIKPPVPTAGSKVVQRPPLDASAPAISFLRLTLPRRPWKKRYQPAGD